MFGLSFKNGNDDLTRDSFDECYMPLVEIKDFNTWIIMEHQKILNLLNELNNFKFVTKNETLPSQWSIKYKLWCRKWNYV